MSKQHHSMMDIDGIDSKYNMNHESRGIFLIINNKTFDPKTHKEPRYGTDLDAEMLQKVFEKLGFDVRRRDNLTCMAMDKAMREVGALDYSSMDAFGCAILTHGSDHNNIFGTDGVIPLDLLVEPVRGEKCLSLIGKPKLFFIMVWTLHGPTFLGFEDMTVYYEPMGSKATSTHYFSLLVVNQGRMSVAWKLNDKIYKRRYDFTVIVNC